MAIKYMVSKSEYMALMEEYGELPTEAARRAAIEQRNTILIPENQDFILDLGNWATRRSVIKNNSATAHWNTVCRINPGSQWAANVTQSVLFFNAALNSTIQYYDEDGEPYSTAGTNWPDFPTVADPLDMEYLYQQVMGGGLDININFPAFLENSPELLSFVNALDAYIVDPNENTLADLSDLVEASLMPGESPDYERKFGPESEEDGYGYNYNYGTFDDTSDQIDYPAKPRCGILAPGIINAYKTTTDGLAMLGEALFPDLTQPPDVLTALVNIASAMWNGKLIDYVLDAHIIPVDPAAPALKDITCGGHPLLHPTVQQPYRAYAVAEDYCDFDCGSLSIPEYWKNFLDFRCKSKLFLPFIGFVNIAPEYWNGGTLSVKYRFNIVDGSFMAYVKSTSGKSNLNSTVIGQYSGSACVHIPVNSRDYSAVISGIMAAGGSMAVGAAGGLAAGAYAHVGSKLISGAANAANQKPTFEQSNSYNGSGALLSERCPYLVIERPAAQFSSKYTKEIGLPLNKAYTLSSVTGYTVCAEPNIDFACSQEEAAEIVKLLTSGVIL